MIIQEKLKYLKPGEFFRYCYSYELYMKLSSAGDCEGRNNTVNMGNGKTVLAYGDDRVLPIPREKVISYVDPTVRFDKIKIGDLFSLNTPDLQAGSIVFMRTEVKYPNDHNAVKLISGRSINVSNSQLVIPVEKPEGWGINNNE